MKVNKAYSTQNRRGEVDPTIILVVVILIGIGLVMVFSASYVISAEGRNDPYFFLRRQVFWTMLGLIGMWFFSRFDYRKLRPLSPLLVLISLALLTLVFIPGIGIEINEAKRWIGVGTFTIQPSEFTKLALVIFTAAYFSGRSVKMEDFWSGAFIPLMVAGISFLFILGQPDLGTGLVILASTFILIFLAGIPVKQIIYMGVAFVVALIPLTVFRSYRLKRLTTFLDPWADPLGEGWHTIQSLYALGSGGLFGVGLGRSRQKLYYLPEPHNDFIFAIIGEELGLAGAVAVLLLFFVLIWRGMRVALMVQDTFGSLLAAGITFMIGIQVFINIGVVTATLPVTGLNLPLVSAGGSSMLFNLCALGILLNISRHIGQGTGYRKQE